MFKRLSKTVFIALILSMLLLTGAACGCGGGSKKTTTQKKTATLVYWRVNDDSRVFDRIVKWYHQTHSNVTIQVVKKDEATYETELLNALAAGNGPDLAQIRDDWLPRWQEKIVPVSGADNQKLLNADTFKKIYVDVATNQLVNNNQVYGIPLSIGTLAIYYRQKEVGRYLADNRIQNFPTDWNSVLKIIQGMTEKDGSGNITSAGMAIGTADNVPNSSQILQLLMMQNGAKMVADDHRGATFNTSSPTATDRVYYPGTEALKFYTSFSDPRQSNYTWNKDMGNALDAFVSGKAKMMIGYPWLASEIYATDPTLQFKIAPFPQVAGTEQKKNYPSYFAETVTKNAADRGTSDLAWEFLVGLAGFGQDSGSYTEYLQMANRIESTRKRYLGEQSEELNQNRVLMGTKVFYEQNQTATDWYKGKYPEKVDAVMTDLIRAVTLRGQTFQSAIDTASSQVTSLLQE